MDDCVPQLTDRGHNGRLMLAHKNRSRRVTNLAAAALVAVMMASACSSAASPDNAASCDPEISAIRTWNEAALDAIRRDFPAPTVHARNLYHLAAAGWDAWASYDDGVVGLFVAEAEATLVGDERDRARSEAISYSSYRLLTHRYAQSDGSEESLAQFDATMAALCLSTDLDAVEQDSPAARGLGIADAIISATLNDGSNEAGGYVDTTYTPVNLPLVVTEPGAEMADPNRWQPLSLTVQVTQNGLDVRPGIQEFIGPS